MKTKDRLKEEIGFYKLLMTIVFAMSSSIVNWLFNNGYDAHVITKIMLFVSVLFFITVIFFFLFEIKSKIKELDHE